MLRWSINLFRIRGIQLTLHGSFFLLLAFYGWQGWSGDPAEGEPGGWPGLQFYVALMLAFFGCVILHELGHSFTAMRYGIGVRRILLMPIGGMAQMDEVPRQPSRELAITFAGPAVNFAIAAVLWFGLWAFEAPDDAPLLSVPSFLSALLWSNLAMGLFNFLPAFPMDGGRILRALLATGWPYLRATFWAATIGKIVAALAIAVLWLLVLLDFLPPTNATIYTILFVFVMAVGELEYRAAKRREIEDAHGRAVLARRYAAGFLPLASEPPILPT
jgi:Zn-dependent protease